MGQEPDPTTVAEAIQAGWAADFHAVNTNDPTLVLVMKDKGDNHRRVWVRPAAEFSEHMDGSVPEPWAREFMAIRRVVTDRERGKVATSNALLEIKALLGSKDSAVMIPLTQDQLIRAHHLRRTISALGDLMVTSGDDDLVGECSRLHRLLRRNLGELLADEYMVADDG